jgi:hypothetical protein
MRMPEVQRVQQTIIDWAKCHSTDAAEKALR